MGEVVNLSIEIKAFKSKEELLEGLRLCLRTNCKSRQTVLEYATKQLPMEEVDNIRILFDFCETLERGLVSLLERCYPTTAVTEFIGGITAVTGGAIEGRVKQALMQYSSYQSEKENEMERESEMRDVRVMDEKGAEKSLDDLCKEGRVLIIPALFKNGE